MLGGDVAFQNFTSVAQKVFSVPLAVVVHVNPTSTAGGGGGAGGAGGMRTVASKGGAIDRIKFDGVKRDANSRFYAIFPEGFDVVVIDDCTKVCHTSGILRPLTEPLRSAVPSPCTTLTQFLVPFTVSCPTGRTSRHVAICHGLPAHPLLRGCGVDGGRRQGGCHLTPRPLVYYY